MKKIIIIAMLAALSSAAMAQDTIPTPNDLSRTNEAVASINDALRRHANMAVTGIAVTAVGALLLGTHDPLELEQHDRNVRTFYVATMTGGMLLFAASYAPLLRNKVRFDGRGLVSGTRRQTCRSSVYDNKLHLATV